jgi:PD-(D/E)XK nuclease superfamily
MMHAKHADTKELNEPSVRMIGCAFTVRNTLETSRQTSMSWTCPDDALSVEMKTVKALDDAHRMPCTKYLRATGPQRCLLLNFGEPRLETKRVAHGL